jgi:hypothetical protein
MKTTLMLLGVVSLSACGSTTAELLLFDAAPAGVTAVELFIATADVHVDDKDKDKSKEASDASIDNDGKWQTLEVNRSIDLMQHEGESAADVLGQLELPEGKVTQIRLTLDTSQPNTATYNGSPCDLDLSRVDAQSLKINHAFKALDTDEGDEQKFYVHVDLEKSLTAQGNCFRLEPKIQLTKVKIDGEDAEL